MFKKGSIAIFAIIFVFLAAGIFVVLKQNKNITSENTVTPTAAATVIPSPSATPSQSVPLPTQEDVIRLFFQLINNQKASEAVAMLSQSAAPDDSSRQMWGVNFNSIKEVKVVSVEKVNIPDLQTENEYKIALDVKVKNSGGQYGWENGQDTRFIPLVKENGVWKIDGITTGP